MTSVVEEFRSSRGAVASPFRGSRMLLLTTVSATGAKSTAAVPYLLDDTRLLLIAADGQETEPPAWLRDVRDHPRVTVDLGTLTYQADAELIGGDERSQLFARAVEADPRWAELGSADSTPVVALREVEEGPPDGRLGDLLVAAHDIFRRELAMIRNELVTSGPSGQLAAQLKVNCVTMCHWIHGHHTAESEQLFPVLGRKHPELGEVLSRIDREHEVVRGLLEEMKALLRAEADMADLVREFDRLTAEFTSHLRYEEEQLIAALNEFTLDSEAAD